MSWLDVELLLPAFVAGLFVLLTHVPLGREVLHRGIIFIDLAIAQVAGMAVLIGVASGLHGQGISVFLLALGAAWLASGFFFLVERYWPERQEAIIGVTYVLAATTAVLVVSDSPTASESLKSVLVGQILWVTWSDLWIPILVNSVVFLAWFSLPMLRKSWGFYALFALVITVSVPLIGVYLVFSSLIIPALMLSGLRSRWAALWGIAVGGLAYAAGLGVSLIWDWPSGAVIVWALLLFALLFRLPVKHWSQP